MAMMREKDRISLKVRDGKDLDDLIFDSEDYHTSDR